MRRALLYCAIAFAVACGDSITEPIPDRTQVTQVTTPVAFATTTTEDGLSISTDKDDYQPGDTVHFTGSGWQPGDVLDVVLTDEPLTHDPHTWSVNVGDDGTFQDSTYVVDTEDLGVTFTLTATSRANPERTLTVTFTDGNIKYVTSPVGLVPTITYSRWNGSATCTGSPNSINQVLAANTNLGLQNSQSIRFTVPAVSGYAYTGYSNGGLTVSPSSSAAATTLCVTGLAGSASGTLTLNFVLSNQPPVVDAEKDASPNEYSGDEGSHVSLTGDASDPDGNPLTTTWTYSAGAGVDGSASCSFGDASALVTTVTCTDDGEFTLTLSAQETGTGNPAVTSTAKLTIANVAPTADFNAPSSVDEGTAIALSLTNADDASSVDEIAGFTYAFDCGSGYGAYSATTTASCPTTDGPETPTRIVKGKIKDKDGDATEYNNPVTVNNVAPTIATPLTKPDGSALPTSITVGGTVVFKASFTDPGTGDTHTAEITCSPASTVTGGGAVTPPSFEGSCTFTTVGSKTISVKVTDDDGDFDVESYNITVVYDFRGFFTPVDNPGPDNNVMNVANSGQAIPLKWQLLDYAGNPVTTLSSVKVTALTLTCFLGTTTDLLEEYAAGASGLQNLGNGFYQLNWKTPTSYAKSCKTMNLDLGEGAPRTALFQFRK